MKITSLLTTLLTTTALLTGGLPAHAERSYQDWLTIDQAQAFATPTSGLDVATNSKGDVICLANAGIENSWRLVSHDPLSGERKWTATVTSTHSGSMPVKMLIDGNDDIFVIGTFMFGNDSDIRTIKFNGSTGQQIWSKTFKGIGVSAEDTAVDMILDQNGDVIIAGDSLTFGGQSLYDIITIKYNGNTGNQEWVNRYAREESGFNNSSDHPTAMALVPGSNDVVVTGHSGWGYNAEESMFVTLRYDSVTGTQEWVKKFDGFYGEKDIATDVAVTPYGVYVIGKSEMSFGATLKYQTTVVSYDLQGNPGWVTVLPGWVTEARSNSLIEATSTSHLAIAMQTEFSSGNYSIYSTLLARQDGVAFGSVDSRPADYKSGDSVKHSLRKLILDTENDAIIVGTAGELFSSQLMLMKHDFHDVLVSQRLPTSRGGAVCVDTTGSIVATGAAYGPEANGAIQRMATVRFGRFPLSKGDLIITGENTISIGQPVATQDGQWLARVQIQKDGKILNGIRTEGNFVYNRQGNPISGLIPNASLQSLGDPISSSDGDYAYTAKLSGVPLAESNSVWVNFNGSGPKPFLQTGKVIPGAGGPVLSSVLNIGLSPNYLAALVRIKGTGVTTANSMAVVCQTTPTTGKMILRTGELISVNGSTSKVTSIRMFTPTADTAGNNRSVADTRIISNLGLADGRTVMISSTHTGTRTMMLATGGAADIVSAGAKWRGFAPPAIPSSGSGAAALATLQTGAGGVTSLNDTAVIHCGTIGGAWTMIAREGAVAPGTGGASFASFTAPLKTNAGHIYFMATLKGTGVTTANKSSLWVSYGGAPALVLRTGMKAVNIYGDNTTNTFTSIKSYALPHSGSAKPIILATIKGTGITTANNTAVYAFDSSSALRELVRTGRQLGSVTVKALSVLKPVPGASGASRSFNSQGVVNSLITLSDGTHAVMQTRVP